MKKVGLFFIIGLLFIMVTVWTLYSINKINVLSYEIRYVDSLKEDTKEMYLCVLNDLNQLEMVNIKLPNNYSSDPLMILKLYNEHRNIIPIGYTTPVVNNMDILSSSISDNILNVSIDNLDKDTNISHLLKSWMWTFQNYGVETINLKYKNKLYTVNANCDVNSHSSSIGQNKSFFYIETTNGYIPITYRSIYQDYEGTINGLFDYFNIYNVTYEIDLQDNDIYLYLTDQYDEVTKDVLKQIAFNFNMLKCETIVIVKNGIIVNES